MDEDIKYLKSIDGNEYWSKNGKYHRIGGPSISYKDGRKFWHIDGKSVTKQEHDLLYLLLKLKGLLCKENC
jgi:hypothetical protein